MIVTSKAKSDKKYYSKINKVIGTMVIGPLNYIILLELCSFTMRLFIASLCSIHIFANLEPGG